ncbi:MAG: hypothetical protein Pg6C_20420 [Treponemataceae bacterium]|nr:MAG: hypothetical protein Pg6C_20420 [Treponemataceae bacterium]
MAIKKLNGNRPDRSCSYLHVPAELAASVCLLIFDSLPITSIYSCSFFKKSQAITRMIFSNSFFALSPYGAIKLRQVI